MLFMHAANLLSVHVSLAHLIEFISGVSNIAYPPPCRRHSCVYNPAEGKSSSFPDPVFQSSRFPDPVPVGVGVWRSFLETHSGESILRGVQGGSLRAAAWIATPLEVRQSCLVLALLCAILALLGLILSPSCSKMAPSWPNIGQHRAKMNQHGLQEHPQDPQKV